MGMKHYNVSRLMKDLRDLLEPHTSILFAYLYGSSVSDPNLFKSDLDIAVYLKHADPGEYVRKEEELTGLLVTHLHSDRIDLRILNTLPLLLKYSILKDGKLIFCRDELERVDFETEIMMRFFDLKVYLDEYRSLLSQRIRGRQ